MNTDNPTPDSPEQIEQMEQILADTEQLTRELREEIRLQRQREAIENLPELLNTVEKGKWSNLKLLLEELVNEVRERRQNRNGA